MPYSCLSLTAKLLRILTAALALAGFTFLSAAFAQAQTETTIYDFGTTAPDIPYSGVVSDAAGNLYGVAPFGGSGNHGVVYELSLVNGAWQAAVLYNFTGGTDGATPYATPIFDAAGNLYGTASGGGAHGYGVVFKLSPSAGGWQQSVLYSFTGGNDGMAPMLGNIVMDKAGNLYGSNVAGANLTSEACQQHRRLRRDL